MEGGVEIAPDFDGGGDAVEGNYVVDHALIGGDRGIGHSGRRASAAFGINLSYADVVLEITEGLDTNALSSRDIAGLRLEMGHHKGFVGVGGIAKLAVGGVGAHVQAQSA